MKDFHELKVWQKAHQLTAERTTEVKRMLTVLRQKLTDR